MNIDYLNNCKWFLYFLLTTITHNEVLSIIHQEIEQLPCSRKISTSHYSFLLTENEGLRLYCGVCALCERILIEECKPYNYSLEQQKKEAANWDLIKRYKTLKKDVKQNIENTKQQVKATGQKALDIMRYRDELNQDYFENNQYNQLFGHYFPKLFFTKTDENGITNIVAKSPSIFVTEDLLLFRHTSKSDSGTYECFWRGHKRKSWSITVLKAGKEPYREIYYPSDKINYTKNRRLKPLHLRKANFIVYSKWSNWSDCNICSIKERNDKIYGVQLRVGHCFIKKIDFNQPTRPENAVQLSRYKAGLPCRSHLIPTKIRSLKSVAYRPSEMEIKRCFIYCKARFYYKATFLNKYGNETVFSEYRYRTGLSQANIFVDYKDGSFIRSVNYSDDTGETGGADDVDELEDNKLAPPRIGSKEYAVGRESVITVLKCPFTESITGGFMWFRMKEKPGLELGEIVNYPVDLYNLFRSSRGRLRFDPGYNIIINSLNQSDHGNLFVCMHNFKVMGYIYVFYVPKKYWYTVVSVMAKLVIILTPPTLVILTMMFIFTILRKKMLKEKKLKKTDFS